MTDRIKKFFSQFLIKSPSPTPKLEIAFVKYNIDAAAIPREYRDVFMKILHNVYLTRLESVVAITDEKEKIRVAHYAEEDLFLYNTFKNLNITQDQKVKIEQTKEHIKEEKNKSFLFGSD